MPGCAAVGCNNRSEKGYTMKCFPRDPVLRQIWKNNVGRADWEPSNNSFLCHVHFEPNQWIVTHSGRVKLRKGALPSIFKVTSTRKSSKKLAQSTSNIYNDDDLEEYQVEYLENDDYSSFSRGIEKGMDKLNSLEEEESATSMENSKIEYEFADVNAGLENHDSLQEIESDKDPGNMDRLDKNGAKNHVKPVKVEIKNEMDDSKYREIEKRMKLICDGESSENTTTDQRSVNDCAGKDVTCKPESESSAENVAANRNEKSLEVNDEFNTKVLENEPTEKEDSSNMETALEYKIKSHDIILKSARNSKKESTFTIKVSGIPEDVCEIVKDLDSSASMETSNSNDKFVTSIITVDNSLKRNKPKKNRIRMNDSEFLNEYEPFVAQNSCKETNFSSLNEDTESRMKVQKQIIDKLTNQLAGYKDFEFTLKSMDIELKKKHRELELLKRRFSKKIPPNKKLVEDDVDEAFENTVDNSLLHELTSRVNQLEETNKKLMKSFSNEVQNKKKLEYQVKDRENKIKELNWKLDKASKFLERSEKNTNKYRRKLLTLQTLLRRKNQAEEKKNRFSQMSTEERVGKFSDATLAAALSILKTSGYRGYVKLLNFNFPLPSIPVLRHRYPEDTALNYILVDEEMEEHRVNKTQNVSQLNAEDMEFVYDSSLENENEDTIMGTVQDIFDESVRNEEILDISDVQKHFILPNHASV